mmetsp:Transcript_52276/g.136587  ORF Transcript_52276/g.136587 Transcript_52276/m.136587 type:complete len:205 (+) Transcript_52276:476-1090(+)
MVRRSSSESPKSSVGTPTAVPRSMSLYSAARLAMRAGLAHMDLRPSPKAKCADESRESVLWLHSPGDSLCFRSSAPRLSLVGRRSSMTLKRRRKVSFDDDDECASSPGRNRLDALRPIMCALAPVKLSCGFPPRRMMLAGFTSLWITPRECNDLSAEHMSRPSLIAASSEIGPLPLRTPSIGDPSSRSITHQYTCLLLDLPDST